MSLSIILLLSIALMHSFENRSLEIQQLKNSRNFFQASVKARTAFRILLTSIEKGGVFGFHYLNKEKILSKIINVLLDNVVISDLKINSLDHHFEISKVIRTKPVNRQKLLENLLRQTKQDPNDPTFSAIEDTAITNFTDSLTDWVDADMIDSGSGGEDYPDANPLYTVKNRYIDYLEELRLLPSFRELGLSGQEIKDNFRASYRLKDSVKEAIDINLASKEEIVFFLKRYQDSDRYPNIDDSTSEGIADEVVKGQENFIKELKQGNFSTKYPWEGKINGRSEWLKSLPVELKPDERELFSFRTHLLRIEYSLSIGQNSVSVESVLYLGYKDNKSNDLKAIEILTFKLSPADPNKDCQKQSPSTSASAGE
jgi:hypothetical protein